MHRQPSRSAANLDTIDCLVNSSDLAIEEEVDNQKYEQRRELSNPRRDQTSKRSNENLTHRTTRHSPPSVTRKRHASPPSMSSSSTTRTHRSYYPSPRHHRASSPSSSPPPQSSSRHHRPNRPITALKRPHSKSRSPYERRPPTHRSRPESSRERTIDDVFTSSTQQQIPKKIISNQDTINISIVSEDDTMKTHNTRSNGASTNQSSSMSTNNKLHSTPSFPILQPNSSENLLDMSNISQDYELSIFAKSVLSATNTNSILTPPILPTNDCLQTIDLLGKYKMMQAMPSNNPQIEACSKEILILIQKQIEVQKIELNCREREIKLRERELEEREKRFNEKSNDTTSTTSLHTEPPVAVKSTIIEDKSQPNSDIIVDQDTKNVPKEESVVKSISPTVDTTKGNLLNKIGVTQPSVTRKTSGKSRFSQITVDPSIFSSQSNSKVDLYSDDHDDNQSSSSLNTNNSLKKATISKILAPSDSTIAIVDTDLKVTSSNSCRKVEFQSGNINKTSTSKGSSHDLRLTLSKNRTKQPNNDVHDDTTNNQLITDDEQTITTNKTMPSKLNSNKDDKQQSHDYHQQRSITSTSIETIIDNNNDKRDNHRQQRTNSSRQQQQQYSSSSTSNLNDRTYTHGSTSQQPAKYGSNQKRQEDDDLRPRLLENKNPKSSRTTHRNNY